MTVWKQKETPFPIKTIFFFFQFTVKARTFIFSRFCLFLNLLTKKKNKNKKKRNKNKRKHYIDPYTK